MITMSIRIINVMIIYKICYLSFLQLTFDAKLAMLQSGLAFTKAYNLPK